MHRSIAGISTKEGRFFIAKRIPGGSLGGKWEFPGGKLETGETCEEALEREYQEEFQVKIRVKSRICEVEFDKDGEKFTLNAYYIDLLSENFILSEHTETAWTSIHEILKMDFAFSDRKILPYLQK